MSNKTTINIEHVGNINTDVEEIRTTMVVNTVNPENIYREFKDRLQQKREKMPSADDCPWSQEEYEAYREGLLQGYMWAEEILTNILR